MSDRRTVLLHLDTDRRPSSFDRIVAIDAGADHVLSYSGVEVEEVRDLIHGALFTRGPKHLHRTAVFVGGADAELGERIVQEIRRHFLADFGLTVSVLIDTRGAATTAAAIVFLARNHLPLQDAKALVLGTGPVGCRVTRLLARAGADVLVGFADRTQAEAVQAHVLDHVPGARIDLRENGNDDQLRAALAGRNLLVCAGPAGRRLVTAQVFASASLALALDLNAVPPSGIEGIAATARAVNLHGSCCYGALAVGDHKMRIHKTAIARLFERNDQMLDAEHLLDLAATLEM